MAARQTAESGDQSGRQQIKLQLDAQRPQMFKEFKVGGCLNV